MANTGLFSSSLASAGGMGTRVGAAFVEIFADTAGLSSGFGRAEALTRSFGARMSAAGAVTARVGASMTRSLTVPILAIAGVSAKMASDFETSMTKVSALAGVAQKDIAGFREDVLRLAGATAQAPVDLAEALYFVASAGLKDAQVLPVLAASARGAAAQMGDAATIGHLLTGVLVAYQKEAPSAAQAMDILVTAIKEGKAEPADLASHLGTVIPVAAQMKVSFDEVAGAIAAATNVNIEAARAATGLRYMLIQLQNPTEAAKKELENYGLTVKDVQTGIERDLITGLRDLGDTLDLTTTAGREAFFTIIGGVRSGQVALALMGESAKRTQSIMDATAKAAGDTGNEFDAAFEKMRATPGFQFQKAWNDLKVAAIEVGVVVLPIALDIVRSIADIATAFSNLPDPIKASIVTLGLWVAAAGPLLAVFGRLVKMGAAVAGAFTATAVAAPAASVAGAAVAGTGGAFAADAGMASTLGLAAPAGAAGGGASMAAVAGTAAAEIAAIAAAVVVGGALIVRTVDDISASNGDLAETTGMTVENVELLRSQVATSATALNIFSSQADKVREAGDIANEVIKDLADSGLGMALATRLVNEQIEFSIHDIGGLTGSMDTLEQNLRGRLGLLETADAATLLDRRLGELLNTMDNVGSMTAAQGGDTSFVPTMDPEAAKQFVAALIAVKDSGLNVADVFGDQMRAALDSQQIKWSQLEVLFRRAGVAMPFEQAGQFARAIFEANVATDAQRHSLADALGILNRFNVELSRSDEIQIGSAIAASNLAGAQREVNDAIGTDAVDAVLEHLDSLNKDQQAWVANKLAAGDYLAVLERIEAIERQQAREARQKRKTGFTPGGDPTAAVGAVAREQAKVVQDLLATEPKLKSWGAVLEDAVGVEPQTFSSIVDVTGRLASLGVKMGDLSAKTRKKLKVAIDAGDSEAVLETLLGILLRLDKVHAKPTVSVNDHASAQLAHINSLLATMPTQKTVTVDFALTGRGLSMIDNQTGGWVPGSGPGDHVPMMLEPGEFVVRKQSARMLGDFLEDANARGSMAFYRPQKAGRSGGGAVMTRQPAIRAESRRGGDRNLNVHVHGGQGFTPEDVRRNLESWWRRRPW